MKFTEAALARRLWVTAADAIIGDEVHKMTPEVIAKLRQRAKPSSEESFKFWRELGIGCYTVKRKP